LIDFKQKKNVLPFLFFFFFFSFLTREYPVQPSHQVNTTGTDIKHHRLQ